MVEDISIEQMQSKINDEVAKKSKQDFEAAVTQCQHILAPFLAANKFCTHEDRMQYAVKLRETIMLSNTSGNILILHKAQVPEWYIEMQQHIASNKFVRLLNSMQDRLDEVVTASIQT